MRAWAFLVSCPILTNSVGVSDPCRTLCKWNDSCFASVQGSYCKTDHTPAVCHKFHFISARPDSVYFFGSKRSVEGSIAMACTAAEGLVSSILSTPAPLVSASDIVDAGPVHTRRPRQQ